MNDWLVTDDTMLKDYLSRELEYTDKGQIKSSTTNIITVLVNPSYCVKEGIIDGRIFFDTCSRTIRLLGVLKGEKTNGDEIRKWNDQMTNILGVEIESTFGIKYSKNRMEDAITFVAQKRAVNLPALYMKSLSYDGGKYIENLLPKYLGATSSKLNAWIMEHILVGMVKRVFEPGCKFDELMVLTGDQGAGKTSFIEKLALLPEWYCSLNNIKGKDAISNLVGKIIVELEEFVALRNAKSADEAKLFNLHDFYLLQELRQDLDFVIQTHKNENRHVQNFLDFMEWKATKSDTPNLLCSAEFTSRYPETNEKVFSELMANEMRDEWLLEPSVKSKRHKIDGIIRVSKKFYTRNFAGGTGVGDFIEVDNIHPPF